MTALGTAGAGAGTAGGAGFTTGAAASTLGTGAGAGGLTAGAFGVEGGVVCGLEPGDFEDFTPKNPRATERAEGFSVGLSTL